MLVLLAGLLASLCALPVRATETLDASVSGPQPEAPAEPAEETTASGQESRPERVSEVLAELARLIAGSSITAAQRLREERDLLNAAGLAAALAPLEAALEDYDFDTAQRLLQVLREKSTPWRGEGQ